MKFFAFLGMLRDQILFQKSVVATGSDASPSPALFKVNALLAKKSLSLDKPHNILLELPIRLGGMASIVLASCSQKKCKQDIHSSFFGLAKVTTTS